VQQRQQLLADAVVEQGADRVAEHAAGHRGHGGHRGEADRLFRFGQAHQRQQRVRRHREEARLDEGEGGQPPLGMGMRRLVEDPVVQPAQHRRGDRGEGAGRQGGFASAPSREATNEPPSFRHPALDPGSRFLFRDPFKAGPRVKPGVTAIESGVPAWRLGILAQNPTL
jgi:hypothetical protein